MKMLTSRTPVANDAPFRLSDVKAHLRVIHSEEDAAIAAMAWTAAAEIEHFAQIALIDQMIRVTIFDPSPTASMISLPIGPARADTVATVLVDGLALAVTDFELVPGHRPFLHLKAGFFDRDPIPARMSIEYIAGFGGTAAAIPRDLAQAIADQAAVHFDNRAPNDARALTTSPHMQRIGARYRGVKI